MSNQSVTKDEQTENQINIQKKQNNELLSRKVIKARDKPKESKISKKVDFIMDNSMFPVELQLKVVSYIPINMSFTSKSLEFYKKYLLNIAKEHEIKMTPNKFRHDHLFMNKLIEKFPQAKEFILNPNIDVYAEGSTIIQMNEMQFYYYRRIVLVAVRNYGLGNGLGQSLPLQYVSKELKNDHEIVMTAVKYKGFSLRYASDKLKHNRDIVLVAVRNCRYALEYASEELKNDHEIVLAAVQTSGYALEFASDKLKNNRDIVLVAVRNDGKSLRFASEEFKNDREVVFAAVRQNGHALEYASEEFKNDREIVLTAIHDYGLSLKYVSKELKNDHEIVMTAVRKNGYALRYASDELQNYREIVEAAVQQDPDAIQFVPYHLQVDEEVRLLVEPYGDFFLR